LALAKLDDHACRSESLFARSVTNDEAAFNAPFDDAGGHGVAGLVIDQPRIRCASDRRSKSIYGAPVTRWLNYGVSNDANGPWSQASRR
jgi:hypothetical protein